MEPMEPRKRRHRQLHGASFHTRRGSGLREFINKLPQIIHLYVNIVHVLKTFSCFLTAVFPFKMTKQGPKNSHSLSAQLERAGHVISSEGNQRVCNLCGLNWHRTRDRHILKGGNCEGVFGSIAPVGGYDRPVVLGVGTGVTWRGVPIHPTHN